jgi:hypothetical protein
LAKAGNVVLESLELDAGHLVSVVPVMWADVGIIGVVVPEDLLPFLRSVVLKPI